jgi:hypothetical protein
LKTDSNASGSPALKERMTSASSIVMDIQASTQFDTVTAAASRIIPQFGRWSREPE